jgi:transcription elongation factor Elf1
MAKEKATKETTKEITFHCKFCGESKPISDMTFMTRYFPVLVACRNCDKTLESLKPEEVTPEVEETAEGEAPSESET